jgi:hypothetical protein
VSLVALLRTKSSEYEFFAEWHAERAPVDDQHLVAPQAMLVVGIVRREVAAAIAVEWGDGAVRTEPAPPQLRRAFHRYRRQLVGGGARCSLRPSAPGGRLDSDERRLRWLNAAVR